MTRHIDFQELYNKFVSDYGTEQGEIIYKAYLHNEQLDDTQPLSTQRDAIEGNNTKVQNSLSKFIESEKTKYQIIIDKFVEDMYNEGLRTAAEELAMTSQSFGGSRERNAQIEILKKNSRQLAFNLLDDINKEISLLVTDINLNNIPFNNSELKKEVQNLFVSKMGRLQTQITSETTRIFNTALEFGYKKSGVVTHKMWVAIIDDVTTGTCRTLNGEIVPIGQPFSLGVYRPPAHYNCRSRIKHLTLSET